MMNRILLSGLLAILALTTGACTTTIKRGGVEVSREEAETILAAEESADEPRPDLTGKRIEAMLEALDRRRGSQLLRNLQYLVSLKELAVPAILERLSEAPSRTKANLLYVIGFTRTEETRAALLHHLDDGDKAVRFEAASGLLTQGDFSVMPTMLAFLDDEEKHVRYKAIQSLRIAIGQDFGYQFAAPEEKRRESLARWSDWWQAERARLMVRGGASASR